MPTFPLRQRRWCSAAQQHPTRAARESTASTLPHLRSTILDQIIGSKQTQAVWTSPETNLTAQWVAKV